MKRKIFCLILALSLVILASCGEQDFTFSGAYWNENPQNTAVSGIKEEVLTYKVSSETTAEFSSSPIDVEGLTLVIDEPNSSFETKLSVEGENYVYETTLIINGKYVFDGGEYLVENDTTYTKTVMKGLDDRLFPVYSVKRAENVSVKKDKPTGASDFVKIGYELNVDYGETAEIKITPASGSEAYFTTTEFSVEDYKKSTFLCDDAMVFAFRAIKFTDEATSYDFSTIDCFTGLVKDVTADAIYVTVSADASSQTQKIIPIQIKQYYENGRLLDKKDFSCYGVAFGTTGSFQKTFRFVYYATNPTDADGVEINSTKHVPVKMYQPLTYNRGYLCFTLAKFSAKYI